ncbi:MAG: hypothetical protein JWQ87_2014 [Candidatus Sulfotelmatobacter sp.]|nr:hypothetical protein [Candidatus Sulfotelmatobacter sp.]
MDVEIAMETEKKPRWLRSAFSEADGAGSASRLIMLFHSLAVIGWITHGIWRGAAFPDATTLGGAAAFIVSPYASNKFPTMFGKDQG